jgi:hypothetical protein
LVFSCPWFFFVKSKQNGLTGQNVMLPLEGIVIFVFFGSKHTLLQGMLVTIPPSKTW